MLDAFQITIFSFTDIRTGKSNKFWIRNHWWIRFLIPHRSEWWLSNFWHIRWSFWMLKHRNKNLNFKNIVENSKIENILQLTVVLFKSQCSLPNAVISIHFHSKMISFTISVPISSDVIIRMNCMKQINSYFMLDREFYVKTAML